MVIAVLVIWMFGPRVSWSDRSINFSLGRLPANCDGVFGALTVIALILGGAYLSLNNREQTFGSFLRSLTTSQKDCWMGGVCGGLGVSSDIPAWVWRLIFAILFFGSGTGLLAYVALWIFIPSPSDHARRETSAAS